MCLRCRQNAGAGADQHPGDHVRRPVPANGDTGRCCRHGKNTHRQPDRTSKVGPACPHHRRHQQAEVRGSDRIAARQRARRWHGGERVGRSRSGTGRPAQRLQKGARRGVGEVVFEGDLEADTSQQQEDDPASGERPARPQADEAKPEGVEHAELGREHEAGSLAQHAPPAGNVLPEDGGQGTVQRAMQATRDDGEEQHEGTTEPEQRARQAREGTRHPGMIRSEPRLLREKRASPQAGAMGRTLVKRARGG